MAKMKHPETPETGTGIEALGIEAQELGTDLEALDILKFPPWILQASGLYRWSFMPIPINVQPPTRIPPIIDPLHDPIKERPVPGVETAIDADAIFPILFDNEELRLDVDGRYPQMTASGTVRRRLTGKTHWIAALKRIASNLYFGTIWYKNGDVSAFPYTEVEIQVVRSLFPNLRNATVTYRAGSVTRTRTFQFISPYFHQAEFEYDCEAGATPVLQINTGDHPNRPATVIAETLTIEKVYQRAGIDARRNGAANIISTDGPDANTTWSDAEMHDAMQVYWSRFANKPQWAMWALFAKQHDMGRNLGGIMFDDIGPNERQGTAIFTQSFINDLPANDPAPVASRDRLKFWTAVHEIGHGFNLAHSWQKQLPGGWIPLSGDPEARSFMNYPYNVSGGESAFFANFEYRFTNQELLFMRHAPESFVEMGASDWFTDHGFEKAEAIPMTGLDLTIRVDRDKPVYDFLEPVVVELRLVNRGVTPLIVPETLLRAYERLSVLIQREGHRAQRWQPFAHYCEQSGARVLQPGEHMVESLFCAVGTGGWHISEPGDYKVQVALDHAGGLISNALRLRVLPPLGREDQLIAQDVFTGDAGRVMAFDGSLVLRSGVEAWETLVEKLPKSAAAKHAALTLALPKSRHFRTFDFGAADALGAHKLRFAKPDEKVGKTLLAKALTDHKAAIKTLGSVDYMYYAEKYAAVLGRTGERAEADKISKQVASMTLPKVVVPTVHH